MPGGGARARPRFLPLAPRTIPAPAKLRHHRGRRSRPGRDPRRTVVSAWPTTSSPACPSPRFPRICSDSLFRVVGQVLRPEGTFNQITELPWVYWRFYRTLFRGGPVRLRAPKSAAGRRLFLPGRQAAAVSTDECLSRIRAPTPTSDAGLASSLAPCPSRSRLPARPRFAMLVNAGFHLHARLRKSAIESLDPVRTQERVLRALDSKGDETRGSAGIIGFDADPVGCRFPGGRAAAHLRVALERLSPPPLSGLRQPDLARPHSFPGPHQRHDPGCHEVHPCVP